MLNLMLAAMLAQPSAPADPCNAAGRAEQALAGCPTWQVIIRTPDGRGHMDPASVRRDGDRVLVMTRTLPDTPLDGGRFHSFNTRVALNCAARTTRPEHFTGYDAEGRIVLEFDDDSPFASTPTGSPLSTLLDRFCQR